MRLQYSKQFFDGDLDMKTKQKNIKPFKRMAKCN